MNRRCYLNLELSLDLVSVKKHKSAIVLLFFVLTLVTSGSVYAHDLDPNFNTVFATIKPICSDGYQLGPSSNNCPAAALALPPSSDQQGSLQQQEHPQQQQHPICSNGSRPDANSNCPNSTTEGIVHAKKRTR